MIINHVNKKVMKKILLALVVSAFCMIGQGTNVVITNVGTTFSPNAVTITQNDVVTFTILAFHNAVEVSQATWNANGVTPLSGGFNVPFGGGTLLGSQLPVGIHYYICENHISLGMKGIITVEAIASVPETKTQQDVSIYPNPAKEYLTVQYSTATTNVLEIKLYDLQGKLVSVLIPKTVVSGNYLHSISLTNNVSRGVYVVRILSGDKTTFQKVMIL